jgi:pimeloyl-ACP methyl ester carboxylesterase
MTVSDDAHVEGLADTAEHAILTLADGDIHVCQDGPRAAPALLLIHGSAATTGSWYAMVPMLATSHHVIRIDLLGHGRSAEPADRDYRIPEQARRVGEALDLLGVAHTVVAGHSSGGVTATALAAQRPDLVSALVLINTGPGMDAFIAPEVGIGPTQWPPTDEQVRQAASSGFSRAGYVIPQQLLDDVRDMSFHAFTGTMQASRDYLAQQPLPERLAALGTPLQVIFGELDRRWRSSSAADYRAVPGAQVEMLPGVGHSPILEDPQRAAEILLPFTAIHAAR